MKAFYSDQFPLPLPDGHRFPLQKYARLREGILAKGILSQANLHVPDPASDEQLLRVHTARYLASIKTGDLTEKEVRRLGFPWSPQLVERSRRSVGGTIAACRSALREAAAFNLAGGTHHAYPDHGEGYCVFNDCAVAARAMQAEGLAQRIVILDCDVHQGNGTAAIFASDRSVFTFSIHGTGNFPFHKESSDLDIGLEDGCGDEAYLEALSYGLKHSLDRRQADLAIYLAGADPFAGDRLGRLSLTKAGLAARDAQVFEACKQARLPVAVVLSGGYARDIDEIVDIHLQTICLAASYSIRSPENLYVP